MTIELRICQLKPQFYECIQLEPGYFQEAVDLIDDPSVSLEEPACRGPLAGAECILAGSTYAYAGDYLVKYKDGQVLVMSEEAFYQVFEFEEDDDEDVDRV